MGVKVTVVSITIENLAEQYLPEVFALANGQVRYVDGQRVERTAVSLNVPDPYSAMHERIAAAEASGRTPGQKEPPAVPVSTFCAECLEQQVITDGGATCVNGHGGADSLSYDEAKARREERETKGRRKEREERKEEREERPTRRGRARDEAPDDEVSARRQRREATREDAEDEKKQPGGDGDGNGLPDDIVNSNRMVPVIEYLMDQGFKEEDDLVREAMRIRDRVPMLSRLTNPEERIRRTFHTIVNR